MSWGPTMHPLTDTVGVDLDTHCGYVFTRTLLNARQYGKAEAQRTNHGFHIIITLDEPVHLDYALDIRRILGDDPIRIEYDEAKLRYRNYTGFDTLFTWKNGRKVESIDPGV